MKSILLSAIMIFCSQGLAADPAKDAKVQEEVMKKMMEASTPGPEHKKLSEMAGNWTYTSKNWMKADATPEESKGTSTMKMILGGRYLQQDIKGTAMGQPWEGLGFTGYNKVTKKYETIFMDGMGTGIMMGKGKWDTASNALKDSGKYACPLDGKDRDWRGEWKIIDANNMVYSMYGKGLTGKGKEYKEMEITFVRAK